MRALIFVTLCMVGCDETSSTQDPMPDSSVPAPDAPPQPSCDQTAIVDRVWEFSSNGSYFYLKLDANGTYRRETDVPPGNVLCEHGQWSAPTCGMIEFQTCRGTVERRQWSATGTSFLLDQSTYRVSALNEETAFSFCEIDECD